MIQDIAPHRFDNRYAFGRTPGEEDRIFHFWDRQVFIREEAEEGFLPRWRTVRQACPDAALYYLFSIDETGYFLCTQEKLPEIPGCRYEAERTLRARAPVQEEMFATFTALHLNHWVRSNRYCGRCGGLMEPGRDERRLDCRDCGGSVYPRINPAVIVGVTSGDRLLITRYAPSRGVGVDALVAGFCEIGETLEDTVRREVMEEVGLKVRNLRYYRSQPWGLADDLLAGFYCDVDGDDTIRLDEQELSVARWVNRAEITGQPNNYSLTNEMMIRFREGKEPR